MWKGKQFLVGGREVLIKAVATAIPTYCSLIVYGIVSDIQSLIVRFWWGDDKQQKIH